MTEKINCIESLLNIEELFISVLFFYKNEMIPNHFKVSFRYPVFIDNKNRIRISNNKDIIFKNISYTIDYEDNIIEKRFDLNRDTFLKRIIIHIFNGLPVSNLYNISSADVSNYLKSIVSDEIKISIIYCKGDLLKLDLFDKEEIVDMLPEVLYQGKLDF